MVSWSVIAKTSCPNFIALSIRLGTLLIQSRSVSFEATNNQYDYVIRLDISTDYSNISPPHLTSITIISQIHLIVKHPISLYHGTAY